MPVKKSAKSAPKVPTPAVAPPSPIGIDMLTVDQLRPRPDIYASARAKDISLVGGLSLKCVTCFLNAHGSHVMFTKVFEDFPKKLRKMSFPETLALGAQLGDLIGHLLHRRGRFQVLIPRVLMASVRDAAYISGRACYVWECGDNEDPEGSWARAEFAAMEEIGLNPLKIAAGRTVDRDTIAKSGAEVTSVASGGETATIVGPAEIPPGHEREILHPMKFNGIDFVELLDEGCEEPRSAIILRLEADDESAEGMNIAIDADDAERIYRDLRPAFDPNLEDD